jgi:hypothetical protein
MKNIYYIDLGNYFRLRPFYIPLNTFYNMLVLIAESKFRQYFHVC